MAVRGDQLLVGGDYFPAASQCRGGDFPCGFLAPDGLDYHIRIVIEKGIEIVREKVRAERQSAVTAHVPNEYARQRNANTKARRNCRRRCVEEAHESAADDATTGEGDTDRLQVVAAMGLEPRDRGGSCRGAVCKGGSRNGKRESGRRVIDF